MIALHPLDRPVWSALTSGWSALAVGNAQAWRLHEDYGPFAANADNSAASLTALATLIPQGDEIWIVEAERPAFPANVTVRREAMLHQMTASAIPKVQSDLEIVTLTDADAPEMLALAHLTVPGPFAVRTHRLGHFLGVKDQGRLVAMAGERMRFAGHAEVSGVCTHPDYRGRGYAATLMRAVASAMLDRGETPFLHCYASNSGAIALYETLGFRLRRPMHMAVLGL